MRTKAIAFIKLIIFVLVVVLFICDYSAQAFGNELTCLWSRHEQVVK
jgi:hypothetical protein